MDGKVLVDTLADKLSEIEAETLAYTLGHVNFEGRLNTLAHTVAKVKVKKPGDTLFDVKALVLVDVLACMLAGHPERCGG